MKVLWLTNSIMPDHAVALGLVPSPRAGWMPALAEAFVESGQVSLAVATNVPSAGWRQDEVDGVHYYTIPFSKGGFRGGRLSVSLIQYYQRVVEDFRPDVIHVQGTENFQGLLTGRGYLKCPTVISIQGIIDVCQRYYWGNIPLAKLITTRTLRDWVRVDGLIEQKLRWLKWAKWEREIFATNSAFIGRTTWDRAHTRRMNPKAQYCHCDELIRQPFYSEKWDLGKINRHSIFTSIASSPLKGFHVLVKAAAVLRREFPDITIKTPLARFYPKLSGLKRLWKNQRSMGYARYLTDLIRKEGLTEHIVPFSSLGADGMAEQLLQAHAFVLPSLIENSPNSLAESMLVGTPAVASYVGGVPNMVRDGESALLFNSGDESVLAERLRQLFLDDDMARALSQKARETARRRHCKEKIVYDMIEIYKQNALSGTTGV